MLKIGLIGYGYWGPNLARVFSEGERTCVTVVCDGSADARARAARRVPGARLVADAREVLMAPDVDAVAIATPVHTHYELALAALRLGKHVFVEKPVTETAEQAEHLIEEAARRSLVLMVDHTFVYTPAVRKIRELVHGGDLGSIYYYDSVRVNLGLFQKDVSVLWDLAVHDFAIVEHIFDAAPAAVSANGARHVPGAPENMAHITLFFDDGAIAYINVNWLAPVKVRQTLIGGSRKMIVYDDLEPSEKIKVYDKGVSLEERPDKVYQMRVGYRSGDMWAPNLATTEALRTGADHFADCVLDGGVPMTDGAMGLRVVRLLESATRSMAARGLPVELSAKRRAS